MRARCGVMGGRRRSNGSPRTPSSPWGSVLPRPSKSRGGGRGGDARRRPPAPHRFRGPRITGLDAGSGKAEGFVPARLRRCTRGRPRACDTGRSSLRIVGEVGRLRRQERVRSPGQIARGRVPAREGDAAGRVVVPIGPYRSVHLRSAPCGGARVPYGLSAALVVALNPPRRIARERARSCAHPTVRRPAGCRAAEFGVLLPILFAGAGSRANTPRTLGVVGGRG